ncbi:MAG TPA: UvrB/UvrC motif-containing protein [Phycisphaerales bacterium]|nr:UvrB/UvrC motif-containing protein [Phycisphaerales bacterium]
MPDDPDVPNLGAAAGGGASQQADSPASALPAWGSETREERLARLLRKARALPNVPGVYLMKDHKGVVLYVGKAGRLPDRVSSYFVPSADLGYKKAGMLEVVHDFEVLECEGEWEALLTEARLIKDIGPRFNARLTDDKTFPYLVVTMREDFPRVMVTRDLTDPLVKGARVFGPFTSPGALREAVTLLQKVFKFRTCSLDIVAGDPRNRYFRPCILHSIGQCTAPCADKIGREPYFLDVQRFVKFIESKRSVMLREMRAEMEKAAAAMEYERAASLRDQIKAVERLEERAKSGGRGGGAKSGWQPEAEMVLVEPKKALESLRRTLGLDAPIRCIEAIDIAHLQGGETVGSKVCFVDGRALKNEYRRYRIKGGNQASRDQGVEGGEAGINDDYSSIREVVSRRYREAGAGHELFPDVIVIDGGLGQLHAAMEALAQMDIKPPMVISLAKKEELIYVQERSEPIRLGRENLGLRLVQSIRDEAHRFAQHYHHVLRRKKTLEEE